MKRSIQRTFATFMAVACMMSTTTTAFAATEEDKATKESTIQQLENEKSGLSSNLAGYQSEQAATQSDIDSLNYQLAQIQEELAATTAELEATEAELEQTKIDLEEAKQKEASQYASLKERIKVMYEKGNTSYLEILTKSSDMKSLLNSTEYISKISDYDNNLLKSLQETRDQIAAYEQQLEDDVQRISELKASQEEQQANLDAVLQQKAAYMMSLNQSITYTSQQISDLEASISSEQAALAQIQAEIKAAEEAARAKAAKEAEEKAAAAAAAQAQAAAQASSSSTETTGSETSAYVETAAETTVSETAAYVEPVAETTSTVVEETTAVYEEATTSSSMTVSSSGLVWPCDTRTISDTFGYQEWRGGSHSGLDIAAPYGESIYAAGSGTVMIAGYSSSAGNWVVINHGGGMLSVYMHASALYCSAGQYVSAGQQIAAVGSTGDSTGPHLHFGIMLGSSGGYDGYWVDPLAYL